LLEHAGIGWMAAWDRIRASRVPPHHMQSILRGLGRHSDICVLCNVSFGKNAIMTCRRAARSRSTATHYLPRCYPGMVLAQHFYIAGELALSHRTRQYRYHTQHKTEVASCS
jgi:hypothetical protein